MVLLPNFLQERLASEFRLAADRVKDAEDLPTKVYFFSVFYGETQRILNWHWEPSLALLHQVVQKACTEMQAKSALQQGTPLLKGVPKEWVNALDEVSSEIASVFEAEEIDEEKVYQILKRVAQLSYVLSGNGFYIYTKGLIAL